MCQYIVIFCLSHSFLLEHPFEKYIDKPHYCISCRVKSLVKKSRLIVRNLRYKDDHAFEEFEDEKNSSWSRKSTTPSRGQKRVQRRPPLGRVRRRKNPSRSGKLTTPSKSSKTSSKMTMPSKSLKSSKRITSSKMTMPFKSSMTKTSLCQPRLWRVRRV